MRSPVDGSRSDADGMLLACIENEAGSIWIIVASTAIINRAI